MLGSMTSPTSPIAAPISISRSAFSPISAWCARSAPRTRSTCAAPVPSPHYVTRRAATAGLTAAPSPWALTPSSPPSPRSPAPVPSRPATTRRRQRVTLHDP